MHRRLVRESRSAQVGVVGGPVADPHGSLSIFAEVSVALTGFSGIIIAFRGRSSTAFTKLEQRRLFNLFAMSGAVLLSSLVGICALYLPWLDVGTLWTGASAVWMVFGAVWLVVDLRKVANLDPSERVQVSKAILYPFDVLAVVTLALQAANILIWHEAWPVFVAFTVAVTFALQQFVLLVRMGFRL